MARFRSWHRMLIPGLALVLAGIAGVAYWSGSEIASPERRPLMDYHRPFLSEPGHHGIRVDRFTASDGTPCLIVRPASSGRLGTRGATLRKQLIARGRVLRPFGEETGTLVLLHGRKGRKEDYLPIAERLCAVGFRCLIPDLPAHGEHPGRTSTYGVTEAELPQRLLHDAARRYQFDATPAGLMGMSMGGSVAVHSAARADAPWNALVVISSFDSLHTVIDGQSVRYAGATFGPLWGRVTGAVYQWKSGIPIGSIEPHRQAGSIRIPSLIAHGTADRTTPVSGGRRLFDSLPDNGQKKWVEVPGADHDNVLITDFPIYADLAEWLLCHVAPNAP